MELTPARTVTDHTASAAPAQGSATQRIILSGLNLLERNSPALPLSRPFLLTNAITHPSSLSRHRGNRPLSRHDHQSEE
ncbi:hypothetical protein ACSBOB_23165 [Mesorhizobium sp. ASY16-5R]|uniref:hypothetical protein n=1 Tax=Mesorhizobium sp. ASY16-5R TaxID=3445772 RepID=UPI003F9EEF89